MKAARLAQEERVKQFMATIEPLNTLTRKVSEEAKTEAGTPKKKRIRKMNSQK